MGWFTGVPPGRANAELRRRVAALEATVDALVRHTGLDPARVPAPAPPCSARVQRLVADGQIIAAVKVHRQETGLGLADAKADVDLCQAVLRGDG